MVMMILDIQFSYVTFSFCIFFFWLPSNKCLSNAEKRSSYGKPLNSFGQNLNNPYICPVEQNVGMERNATTHHKIKHMVEMVFSQLVLRRRTPRKYLKMNLHLQNSFSYYICWLHRQMRLCNYGAIQIATPHSLLCS